MKYFVLKNAISDNGVKSNVSSWPSKFNVHTNIYCKCFGKSDIFVKSNVNGFILRQKREKAFSTQSCQSIFFCALFYMMRVTEYKK